VIFTLQVGATSQAHAQHPPHPDESHEHERSTFQAAMQSEGKTEEEALPPDQPKGALVASFSMPLDLDRAAGVEHRGPVPAAPHVRRLARELGVDIHNVPGNGPGGRISEDDVKSYTKKLLASGAGISVPTHLKQPALPDFSKWGKIERVPMRGVRRKTAEHMWEAWSSIPHVTQNDKADITELEQLRTRFGPKAAEAGGKMTVTAIALKVCASALKIFPQFNASIDMEKEEIVYKQFINIGVAVDTDRGLLVPVIRDVDKKNIVELAAELTSCFALHSKHSISELWCLAQKPSIFWNNEGSVTVLAAAASTRSSFVRIRISCFGAEGAKCEPHWRHIVLFAAAYSICLKPQCGQSTLTFAGVGFATGRVWRKVTT